MHFAVLLTGAALTRPESPSGLRPAAQLDRGHQRVERICHRSAVLLPRARKVPRRQRHGCLVRDSEHERRVRGHADPGKYTCVSSSIGACRSSPGAVRCVYRRRRSAGCSSLLSSSGPSSSPSASVSMQCLSPSTRGGANPPRAHCDQTSPTRHIAHRRASSSSTHRRSRSRPRPTRGFPRTKISPG